MKICIQCGELCQQSYCEDCWPKVRESQKPNRKPDRSRGKGYDARWDRLSRKARRLQSFCLSCGTDEDLQADHSPEAWRRYYAGKPIRLKDISVLCGPCNRAKGRARPETPGGERSTEPAEEARPVGQEPVTYCNTFSLGGDSDGGSGSKGTQG